MLNNLRITVSISLQRMKRKCSRAEVGDTLRGKPKRAYSKHSYRRLEKRKKNHMYKFAYKTT